MTLVAGVLVEHSSWGRGKVLHCNALHVVVHFPQLCGTVGGPRRTLHASTPHLSESTAQSDPLLDRIPLGLNDKSQGGGKRTAAKPPPAVAGLEETVQRFIGEYPGLFADPQLVAEELTYKREAHALFQRRFGQGRAVALLASGRSDDVSAALDELFHATNIPSRYEIMAMHDGLKDGKAAARLLEATLAFLKQPDRASFEGLVNGVARLPVPPDGSRVLTWPNVTILPFLASPDRFMVLKPEISELMAARISIDLLYSPNPQWHTFAALQDMAVHLLGRLAPLGARDFIDVQSFMWVTRDFA